MQASRITRPAKIEYPSSDGKPMAETDLHWEWMVTITLRLKRFFANERVYVASDLLIYYEKGNPRKSVAPDHFVVKNCRPGQRNTFLIWKERRVPNFVLETTSKTTRREDRVKKKLVYAQIGVKEYFLYDPRAEWLDPPLQGYRLKNGVYEPIMPDADGGIVSEELGIRFVLDGLELLMFSAATGERLLSDGEGLLQQKAIADAASRLAYLEERRADLEKQRADEEKHRADEEKRRADEEAAARKALEEELAQLRESSKKTNGQKRKNGK